MLLTVLKCIGAGITALGKLIVIAVRAVQSFILSDKLLIG